MKLTKLIFLFVLAVAAVGCNKDDDNNLEPPYTLSTANFVDTYSMNFLEHKTVETKTFSNGQTSVLTTTSVGSVFKNVNFVFNTDGTFTASGLYITNVTIINPDGTSTTDGPNPADISTEIGSGTYLLNISSSKVTITDGTGKVRVFEIKDYTQNSMTLYLQETTNVSNDTSITETIEYRFSR